MQILKNPACSDCQNKMKCLMIEAVIKMTGRNLSIPNPKSCNGYKAKEVIENDSKKES
jgi:hypothetical protein